MILKSPQITLGGTDLSSSCRSMEFDEGAESVEAEVSGDAWRWFEEGIKNGGVTVQFKQDFSSGGVDDVISALGSSFAVVIHPASGGVSTSNPSFTMTMMKENYQRLTGSIGDRVYCTLQLVLAANTGIVRATA